MEIQKRYDALYGEDFWEQSYEGQYGYEILADHTVEKIKYIHAVYDLAEEYGDVSDGSFAAIEKRWKQENAKRQKKVEDGEVIYGLKEYTFDLYMQYEISMYKEIYCNDTDRKGMDLTEEEVAEYYSQGEWVFQDDGEKADLETARIAVERELREKKYDAMIAQMTEDLEVSGDLEAVDRFTLDHLKRWDGEQYEEEMAERNARALACRNDCRIDDADRGGAGRRKQSGKDVLCRF